MPKAVSVSVLAMKFKNSSALLRKASWILRFSYTPDWAITFAEGSVKHIYFVAETKGSMSSMELRKIEETKIECARKFFDEMNKKISAESVRYDVVDSFDKLVEVVGSP